VIVPESWQQAVLQPALSVSSPFTLRLTLARLIRSLPPAEAALMAGFRAENPATAFLSGYQCAMRFIDAQLEAEHWAAFCVSETGLESLSRMATVFDHETGTVDGVKSHAMLANSVIDWFYIVARDSSSGDLVCVRAPRDTDGLEAGPDPVSQPFVPEVPHNSLSLCNIPVDERYLVSDAHNALNKPFRYHEDYLCALSMAGWLMRATGKMGSIGPEVQRALGAYDPQALGYTRDSMAVFDDLIQTMTLASSGLSGDNVKWWKRDRVILMMGEKARAVIRSRL